MDGRGRLAQPLKGIARWGLLRGGQAFGRAPIVGFQAARRQSFWRWIDRRLLLLERQLPRRIGLAGVAFFILSSISYGLVKGDHLRHIIAAVQESCDRAANAAGFRIVLVALAGNRHLSREEVLATAGITGTTSLLLLDVEHARERLKTNPWIADATVLKLYPGELQIGITERAAFALWQKEGRHAVIADDGTVLEPYVAPRLLRLPLVVGLGAETRAKALIVLLDRFPAIREHVRASVLVGARRWNLRLANGIDVLLPESDLASALERLMALDREKQLITRDIVSIDLRLRDRVTVRLSDAAAQSRFDSLNEKPKKKGGNA